MKRISLLLIAIVASALCLQVQSVMAQAKSANVPTKTADANAPSITIDGDFSDWENVPEIYLAEDAVDEYAEHEDLYRVRFCSDAANIYYYAEFSNETDGVADGQVVGEETTNYVANVVDLFWDTDNSSETGFQNYLWTDCGANYILEVIPHEDYCELFKFADGVAQDQWEWEPIDGARYLKVSGITLLANGHAALEGSVARHLFSIPGNAESIKIGTLTQNSNWTETGVLPESRGDGTGNIIRGNMLEVPLYQCEAMMWNLNDLVFAYLDCDDYMFILGEGDMPNYAFGRYGPWHDEEYIGRVGRLFVDSAITKVGSYAFDGCRYMLTADLGRNVEEISWNAFSNCTSLRSVIIQKNIKLIDNNAFYECSALEEMICLATTPPNLGNTVFTGVSANTPLYVPAGAVETYKNSADWQQFPGRIVSLDERKGDAIVVINGDTLKLNPDITTVDVYDDGTMVYNTEENTLTLTGLDVGAGEVEGTVIDYSGSETLTIVLNDESTITADVVISSSADVIITGDGTLVAEGVVPIVGTPNANIMFDGVNMIVRSVTPSEDAIRRLRKTRHAKRLDEAGGPALSGFGSAEFNKVEITPSDAMYGFITSGSSDAEFAMYVMNGAGEQEVLTEFTLTAKTDAVEDIRTERKIDTSKPMYNVLGVQVGAEYKGVVIQDEQTFLLK